MTAPRRIQVRRGTAAQASTSNPLLLAGEHGFEVDTGKFKIGNNVDRWNDLPYANDAVGVIDTRVVYWADTQAEADAYPPDTVVLVLD